MKTILVVDDHATNRELLRTLLEYGGYGVLEAADGADGLIQVRSRNPALVIADILMPTMDGYEFVRRLREDPAVSDTRVIFYTATYLEREAAALAESCGVSCVLTKPCEPEVVLSTVARVLEAPLVRKTIREVAQSFDEEHLRLVTDKLSGVAEDLRRASERFAALLDINLQLASERDPHQLLEKVCRAARGLIGSKYAFLAVGKRDVAETEFFAVAGMGIGLSAGLARPSLSQGEVGTAMSESRAIRMVNPGGNPERVGLPAGYPAVNSLLVAPVRSLKYVYGWICLTDHLGAVEFGEEDERLLTILGAQVGRIYENGSLYQEVQRNEERFRRLFEQASDGIFIFSASHRFLDANHRGLEMLRCTKEELLRLGVADFVVPEERHRLMKEPVGIPPGQTYLAEWTHLRSDGSTFPAEVSARRLNDESILAIVRDLTERRRAESALREREQQLRLFVEHSPAAIAMLDSGMRYLVASRRFYADYDLGDEDITGRTHYEVFPELPGRWREIHRRCLAGAVEKCEEDQFPRANGKIDWLKWEVMPWRTAAGGIGGIIIFSEVITERKRAELSIRRLNRVYAVLSGINSLIVRERDRQRLFEEACRIAVEVGQFGLAWVGVVDSQSQLIRPVAMAGPQAEQDLISGARISTRNEEPEGWGTVGQAVRTRGCVWTNDLSATRGMHADLEEFCRRGYRSAISLPLVVNDDCSAVVVLYSKEAGLFNKDELALLAELAKDISFALTFIEQEEKVHYLAYHDPITGLGNRAHLHAKLTQAIDVARGESHSCVLLLANLNNFHDINNTLGHANGDLLLRQVAERIRATLWGSDSVACLGGDEFAILLARLAESGDIDVVLAKITDAMQATFNVASLPVNLEARIGVAVYPDQADSADLLWQRASVALRAAKELHRPQVKYDRGIDHYTPEHLALLGGLRKAIDVNELVLHYQPKLDLQRQCVIGVEALLRWQHPDRGLLYPDAFIPLAERTSLINPMSTWVLANAMRQGRIWQKAGLNLDIAVNLSARNLMNPGITGEIFDIARSSRFPLDRLTLEVTESAVMADPERGKAALIEFHERGIRISMDDFGIGQSSLTYLKDLPISQIKIDKSFVIGFQQPRNGAIVRSAIQMAHSMEMGVTAEGIEDEATFKALRELGCDAGQGYYFCKPMPADKFVAWLKETPWAPG